MIRTDKINDRFWKMINVLKAGNFPQKKRKCIKPLCEFFSRKTAVGVSEESVCVRSDSGLQIGKPRRQRSHRDQSDRL